MHDVDDRGDNLSTIGGDFRVEIPSKSVDGSDNADSDRDEKTDDLWRVVLVDGVVDLKEWISE